MGKNVQKDIRRGFVAGTFLATLLIFAASGCNDNLLRPKAEKAKAEVTKTESKLYRVEGYFEQKGAVPAAFNSTAERQNARTAMPNMAGIEYSIKAENETTTYSSDDSENIEIDGTFFKLALPQGTWTITVEGKLPDSTSACVVGSTEVTLSAENPVAQVNIAVKPSMNGTGSVNLTVGVAPDSGINGVNWRLDDKSSNSGFIDLSTEKTGNITIDQIQSGPYTLVMEFYSGSSEGSSGQLLYMVRESVNVFDGMTTDTWSGNSPYLISNGIFTVMKNLVKTFAQTTFYVNLGGNDDNSGSLPSSPFMTIQKAVDKAVAMNAVLPSDEDTPYRILLLSDVTYDGTASFANNNAFVNITPTESLHLVIEPYKKDVATIDANRNESNSGRVMYIGENAKVTMNSLTITGGHITTNGGSGGGGGVYNAGTLTMNGCTISSNTVTASAGGVRGGGVYNAGALTLNGCTISGNTAGSESAKANTYGGGICSESGTVTITGATISGNTAISINETDGGGLYLSGGTVEISGNSEISNNSATFGGGIYINTSDVTITSATVSSNRSDNSGGGIYIVGGSLTTTGMTLNNNIANQSGGGINIENNRAITSCSIAGGTISGNTAQGNAGGVNCDAQAGSNAKLTDVTLEDNSANGNGGGIQVVSNGYFTIESCTISGNTADGNGGAIYNNGTLKVQGALSIPCGETGKHDVYLFNSENSGMNPITITGDLTTEDTVATITPGPGGYTEGVQVLKVDSGVSGVTLDDQVGKFNVTTQTQDDGTTTAWYISPEGKLTTKFYGAMLSKENYNNIKVITVGSADDMNKISELASDGNTFAGKIITLQEDVDLDEGYTPIQQFSGEFDGAGHTITLPRGDSITALFTSVKGEDENNLAEVKGLTVNGEATQAGIAAEATNAKISGCTSNVKVQNTSHDSATGMCDVGGIVGSLEATSTVENCTNNGSISSSVDSAYVGGIVGHVYNTSQILYCTNTGSVSGTGIDSYVGGIVGSTYNCYVVNCGNEGPVTGSAQENNEDTRVGGIAGITKVGSSWNYYEGIYNCYNIKSVSGGKYTGGIVGDFGASGSSYGAYVCNIYNSGSVSSSLSDAYIGGVIGRNNAGVQHHEIKNNFYYKADSTTYTGVGTKPDDSGTTSFTVDDANKTSDLNSWTENSNNQLENIDYKEWILDESGSYCKF